MLSSISVPLSAEGNSFPSDDDIRAAMQAIGLVTRYDPAKESRDGKKTRISDDGKDKLVLVGSGEHHKDLAKRNLDAGEHAVFSKEIEKYSVFCGAHVPTKSNVFVTRVTEGAITVWCQQSSLRGIVDVTGVLVAKLRDRGKFPFIDLTEWEKISAPVSAYSGGEAKRLATGTIERGKFETFFETRKWDILLLLVLGILFAATLISASGSTTVEGADNWWTVFSKATWPSFGIAVLTLSATLCFSFLSTIVKKVAWTWEEGNS
ncbi:hypothetical protein GRI43_04880 [Altererythrobacter luteolus]|uniref:Uncharacterized protein n=1 Tax=Pontixanthobacter luteolus TaxID=295089 RepID=A0A6I4UXS4_9SPHN|nr:hypothetical protein [Pontixanthobacter luteolus]MXP46729.1 hypothetical protein [Pontixanthobacter luteolus]